MRGAVERVKNSLSYKLGRITIDYDKKNINILFIILEWWKLKKNHKKNQDFHKQLIEVRPDLKLPPLKNYEDYNEALACKHHLSFKIGQAIIEADKNKFGFGYFKLKNKIRKAKKEYEMLCFIKDKISSDIYYAVLSAIETNSNKFGDIISWITSDKFNKLYKNSKYPPLIDPDIVEYENIDPELAWSLNLPLPKRYNFILLGYGQSGHSTMLGLLIKCNVAISNGGWTRNAKDVYRANYNLMLKETNQYKIANYVNYGILPIDDEEKLLSLFDAKVPLMVMTSDPILRFKNWINHNQWCKEGHAYYNQVNVGDNYEHVIKRFLFGEKQLKEPYFEILKEKYAYSAKIYRYKTLIDLIPNKTKIYYSDVEYIMPNVAFDNFTKLAIDFGFNLPQEKDRPYFETMQCDKYVWYTNCDIVINTKIDDQMIAIKISKKMNLWKSYNDYIELNSMLKYQNENIGVYIESKFYDLFANNSNFNNIKKYIMNFLDSLENEAQRYQDIQMTPKDVIDGFKKDKKLWLHYSNIFNFEFSDLKIQNPEIINSWTYFSQFKALY